MAALVKVWVPDPGRFDAVNVERHAPRARRPRARRGRGSSTPPRSWPSAPRARPRVDGERPHPGPPFRNAYERTKAAADRLARAAAAAGHDVVIVYPGVIYGPGEMTEGNIVARLVADHLNGRLPALVGPCDRRWSYAFVDDVALGPRARARAGRAGERFVLGGENATLAQLFSLVRSAVRGRPAALEAAVRGGLGARRACSGCGRSSPASRPS